jgi:hypothetical protein
MEETRHSIWFPNHPAAHNRVPGVSNVKPVAGDVKEDAPPAHSYNPNAPLSNRSIYFVTYKMMLDNSPVKCELCRDTQLSSEI